jgi:head-tail adaptor
MTGSDLREWIALFISDLAPDGAGGFREAVPSGLSADRPANVRTPTGRLQFAGDQRADRVQEIVTIRYEPGITTGYRMMWRDALYDVVAVRNVDNQDTWLELTCERFEAGQQ